MVFYICCGAMGNQSWHSFENVRMLSKEWWHAFGESDRPVGWKFLEFRTFTFVGEMWVYNIEEEL